MAESEGLVNFGKQQKEDLNSKMNKDKESLVDFNAFLKEARNLVNKFSLVHPKNPDQPEEEEKKQPDSPKSYEDQLNQLVVMGFQRDASLKALTESNGDLVRATNHLLNQAKVNQEASSIRAKEAEQMRAIQAKMEADMEEMKARQERMLLEQQHLREEEKRKMEILRMEREVLKERQKEMEMER